MPIKAVFAQIEVKEGCKTSFTLVEYDASCNLQPHEVLIDLKACALTEFQSELLTDLFKKHPLDQYSVGHHVAGILRETGSTVARFQRGDRVAGVVPLDSESSGCAEMCVISAYHLVELPETLSFASAAACLADGLSAYTALHYQAHVVAGETVLILNAASSSALLVQLCHALGAKVIATCSTTQEHDFLEKLNPPPAHVIEVGEQKSNVLVSCVMEETAGCGVNVIIDRGVRQFTTEDDHFIAKDSQDSPHKHELLSCLAVGGRWVTAHSQLQLDPPDSRQLHLRRASVCFLCEHTWTLCPSQQGRLQHILKDLLNELEKGALVLNISQAVSLSEVTDWMPKVKSVDMGQVVMVNS